MPYLVDELQDSLLVRGGDIEAAPAMISYDFGDLVEMGGSHLLVAYAPLAPKVQGRKGQDIRPSY
jgi:hypothetical protein